MKVRVDQQKCVASGLCVLQAATVFDQDTHGIVKLRSEVVPAEAMEDTEEAADTCPSGAIEIEE